MSKKIVSMLLVFTMSFFVYYHEANAVGIADQEDGKKPHFCVICSSDENTHKMEKQFAERIKIIKQILGDSIDEIALAATVLHKEDALEAVKNRYDENFGDGEEYRKNMEVFFASEEADFITKLSSNDKPDKLGVNTGVAAERVDLLNAAAIIMADSAGWTGQYNEKAYQEALARDGLITGNDVANTIFCEAGRTVDGIFSTGNIFYQFVSGQDVMAEIDRTTTRWHNMGEICDNGYIGGVYNITSDTYSDPEVMKLQREEVAEEIINLIHYYKLLVDKQEEEEDNCDAPTTTSGDFASWKQFGESWSDISVGDGGSIGSIGCLVTSVAIQIARSGTKITNTTDFNPGTFVNTLNSNGGFVGGGAYTWTGHQKIAPNIKFGESVGTSISNTASLAKTLSSELSTKAEGKYQKYIVLQIHHSGSSQHWVAVDSVSGSKVTIFDPGANGNTLDENYSGWVVDSYRTMYATDVTGGSSGTVSSGSGKTSTTTASLNFKSSTYKSRIDGLKDYEQCGSKLNSVALGNSTMCQSGCMVASLSAIQYMYTGQEVDVQKLIKDMIKEGEWSNSSAGMGTPFFDNPSNSPLITSNWGLSGETLNSDNKNTIKENVIKSLKEGKKILLNLGGAKTTYSTGGGHFLMLDHYDTSSKKIYIFNPGGSGTGYITEAQLMSEVLAYNKYGPWAISSGNVSANDPCGGGGSADMNDLLNVLGQLEGILGNCTVRGKKGYIAEVNSMDQNYVGTTTSYGVTELYGKDAASAVGYKNFSSDMASGCAEQEYIDKIALYELEQWVKDVKAYYDSKSHGKQLKEYQYHALALVNHHWPVGARLLMDELVNVKDLNSYEVYHLFLKYNGLSGAQGGLNRREREYHLFYNGDYKSERVFDVVDSESYWKSRIKAYGNGR